MLLNVANRARALHASNKLVEIVTRMDVHETHEVAVCIDNHLVGGVSATNTHA